MLSRFFSPPDSPRFLLSPTSDPAQLVSPRRLIRLSTTCSFSSGVALPGMRRWAAVIMVSLQHYARDSSTGNRRRTFSSGVGFSTVCR